MIVIDPEDSGTWPADLREYVVWLDKSKKSDDGNIPNKLPGRYANPETSGLKAVVNAGSTELPPFELKK